MTKAKATTAPALDTNMRNPDGSFKPMVEGVNAAICAECGKLGRTNRPRPEFRCIRCFLVKAIGRPLTKDDIRIERKRK